MHCILQGATIIDPASQHHRSTVSIRIQNGVITEIASSIADTGDAQLIDLKGNFVSPGWMDMLAAFGDPGHEYRETIQTGAAAAAKGGFTALGLMPNTQPALHGKAEIEYIKNHAAGQLTHIFPYGAVTHNREGKDLTEIYDMHAAGAMAFTDADSAIRDAGILLRSLQYVKPFNGVIINIPNDHKIVGNANVNEGAMSVQLGMYGIPDILEELMVIRDIKLAEYTQSHLHIGIVSSAKVLPHIRAAKEKGLSVTAGVAAYQLYFDETELHDYNAHYKVNPPLRTAADKQALREAVADGTIDVVCSYHLPHDNDSKDVEFEYAAFGMASLEVVFGAMRSALPNISPEQIVNILAAKPRNILNIAQPGIAVGNTADITMFDAETTWTLQQSDLRSKASNNPFVGKTLKGKVLGVINKGKISIA
ncbi:MAG TPA: dihydroorotase [Chitinophagales bacterium]|nr:dihydroorotase [Chitinophagales bacterium]HMZ88538.1 dihydroorotase [Chitinophagales bacterium]HNE45826.1 dihydroorotase [Chitinophagales bacterium]HNF69475.1 dihydroorotase [Chitinophagales bacterium]HNI54049.1 dihydroorotase [Chitinophagales bacterium]